MGVKDDRGVLVTDCLYLGGFRPGKESSPLFGRGLNTRSEEGYRVRFRPETDSGVGTNRDRGRNGTKGVKGCPKQDFSLGNYLMFMGLGIESETKIFWTGFCTYNK